MESQPLDIEAEITMLQEWGAAYMEVYRADPYNDQLGSELMWVAVEIERLEFEAQGGYEGWKQRQGIGA